MIPEVIIHPAPIMLYLSYLESLILFRVLCQLSEPPCQQQKFGSRAHPVLHQVTGKDYDADATHTHTQLGILLGSSSGGHCGNEFAND